MISKCLGCHMNLEDKYHFCSITCACLCGYYSVTKGQLKDMADITQEDKDEFLNNTPRRERPERKYI